MVGDATKKLESLISMRIARFQKGRNQVSVVRHWVMQLLNKKQRMVGIYHEGQLITGFLGIKQMSNLVSCYIKGGNISGLVDRNQIQVAIIGIHSLLCSSQIFQVTDTGPINKRRSQDLLRRGLQSHSPAHELFFYLHHLALIPVSYNHGL